MRANRDRDMTLQEYRAEKSRQYLSRNWRQIRKDFWERKGNYMVDSQKRPGRYLVIGRRRAAETRRYEMQTLLNNRTLASIVEEFFTEDETKSVVFCDAGNGCGFGESGRVVDYDPATMADLVMTDIPEDDDRTSEDGFDSHTQSEWQAGENGYRWRVRF